MRVPLASVGLRDQDIESAIEVLRSGNLTMGAKVAKFEQMMADYLQVKHFVMVNSGSSANLAIIEALLRPTKRKPFLNPGDGVLVPAIAWPTTIWPLVQLNLKPYFVDVSIESIGMDLVKSQELIDNNKGAIKALFPIHPLGNGLDSKTLNAFAELNNLVLINDVCESLGSWDEEGHAGTAGMAGSFSFYFSHHITTMEGGGIATNDSLFANDLRSIRSMGGLEIEAMHKNGRTISLIMIQGFYLCRQDTTFDQWKFKLQSVYLKFKILIISLQKDDLTQWKLTLFCQVQGLS